MVLSALMLLGACDVTSTPDTSAPTGEATTTTTSTTTTTTIPTTTVSTLPGMPDEEGFRRARDAAEPVDGDTFSIFPDECRARRWSVSLPFGSAFIVTAPGSDGSCEVWLGGETENPSYTGLPATYCRFTATDAIMMIRPGDGGPIGLDAPQCAPTGFAQIEE